MSDHPVPRVSVPTGRPRSLPLALALLLAVACGDRDTGDKPPQQAHLEAVVSTGAVGLALRFQCASMDAETALLAYAFDWGDGSAPTGPLVTATAAGTSVEVEHAYAQPGEYAVRCRAQDGKGQAGPWSEPVPVHVRASPSGPVLTVALEGEGSVRSEPDGITCGSTCETGYPENTWVTLEATPAVGWGFSGWAGACGGPGPRFQVLLRGDVRCVARFERRPTNFTLEVEVVGEGDVTSIPAAMACPGPTCAVRFSDHDAVTLTAAPRPGWRFAGWLGDCASPELDIELEHERNRRCTARFLPDVRLAVDWSREGADGAESLAWSPDGSLLAAIESGFDGVLRVWDARTAEVKLRYQHFAAGHVSVAWSGVNGLVATGMSDGRVIVRDPSAWDVVRELAGFRFSVNGVSWSADGKLLAGVDRAGAVRLWDTSTWALVGQRAAGAAVERVSLSPDGRRLAVEVSSPRSAVEVHDLASEQVDRVEGTGFAWSPQGDRFAVGGDGEVRVFAPGEAEPRAVLTEPRAQVSALDWSPDGRWLAVSDWGQSLLVLDASSGVLVAEVPGAVPNTGHRDVRFHPTRPEFAVASSGPLEVGVVTVDAASGTARRVDLTAHSYSVQVAAWSPKGDRLATGGFDGYVRLWGARGEPLHEMAALTPAYTSEVRALSWDSAGRRFATGAGEGTLRLWNAEDGTPVGGPWRHGSSCHQVALSPDGSRLAAVGAVYMPETFTHEEGWVSVWDTASGERVAYFREIPTTSALPSAMTWTPDGSRLLVAWGNLSWTRWEASTGERESVKVEGVYATSGSAAFSPDARQIVAWRPLGFPAIWDVETGALVANLEEAGRPYGLAWSPDGRFISGGSSSGRLMIWDTRTRLLVFDESRAHERWLHATTWHPDGAHLTTVGGDMRVVNWSVTW
ncbi:InlB B-repeat-containing protein [Pyxidicoccus sp. 3LG]